jgi:hypothetical protein
MAKNGLHTAGAGIIAGIDDLEEEVSFVQK